MGESEYSFSLTTFSPSGKLVQIEYALQAVSAGATCLGIKAKNGIVLATEKKPPPLMDETTFQKITLLTNHIGMVYSGIAPDFRVLVKKGRKAAAKYYQQYHEPIPVSQLVRELASVMQEFTQSGYEDEESKKKKNSLFLIHFFIKKKWRSPIWSISSYRWF